MRERQMNEKVLRTQRDALLTNFTRMATSSKFKSLAQYVLRCAVLFCRKKGQRN
jgi:hypothetical protein